MSRNKSGSKLEPKPTARKIGGQPIEDVVEPARNSRNRPSVAEAFPEVAAQWYYPKNCGFGPEDFSYGSKVNAWWQCETDKAHIWRAQMGTRCVRLCNCPFCFGKYFGVKVPPERSLAVCQPDIAKEWHPSRNEGVTPRDVLANSKKSVWWRCRVDPKHTWQTSAYRRVRDRSGCLVCYKQQWLDLLKYPEVLSLFDHKKNLGLKPYNLSTALEYWWRCSKGPDHSWKAAFRKTKFNCPFCTNRKLSVTNSLLTLFPKVAAQLHPTRNNGRTADQIRAYGSERIWWRCTYDPQHLWQSTLDNRTRNESGCPECWKNRRAGFLKKLAAERVKTKRT